MIERLTGTVAAKTPESVVLDVGGVGFALEVSAITLRDMPDIGEQVTVFTHLHVRDDALQLHGFSGEEERELFRLLLGVSKIGPKLALAALSHKRAPDLRRALAGGDVALLSSIPGIGKKTAERLILELKEKVGGFGSLGTEVALVAGGAVTDGGSLGLARAALVELGYSMLEADRLLAPLDPERPVEELIRDALTRRA